MAEKEKVAEGAAAPQDGSTVQKAEEKPVVEEKKVEALPGVPLNRFLLDEAPVEAGLTIQDNVATSLITRDQKGKSVLFIVSLVPGDNLNVSSADLESVFHLGGAEEIEAQFTKRGVRFIRGTGVKVTTYKDTDGKPVAGPICMYVGKGALDRYIPE